MTVGELRKALEGVPDDVPVLHRDEVWLVEVEAAGSETVNTVKRGLKREIIRASTGSPAFVIE